MKELISLESTLAGVFIMQVLKFVWDIVKKKQDHSEDTMKYNTVAVQTLTASLDKLKEQISEIPKMKTDIKRSFTAHKIIAGDKWPEIRKEIMEEL